MAAWNHVLQGKRTLGVRRERGSLLRRFAILPALLLAAGAYVPAHLTARATRGATVTFAEQPGSPPDYVFPLQPAEWFTFANDQEFSYLLYPTLYWIDSNGEPVVNDAMSLAYPPVFSVNAAHDTVATITLKNIHWSDGVQLTTRDVEFWMNLLFANKADWGDYVPGQFPDNVKSIGYLSKTRFAITFNRTYNQYWLQQNELNSIIPMPQHAWDRTSLSGPVGNYDQSKKGAVAVWTFLNKQSTEGSTYATSPLWRVVDGPWAIEPKVGYNATTGYLVLVPNPRYFGKSTHSIAKFIEEPFTSTSAEFNAVRSGSVDYGFLPLEDATSGLEASVRSEGYQIVPWNIWGWNFWPVNFAQPTAGPIFKQTLHPTGASASHRPERLGEVLPARVRLSRIQRHSDRDQEPVRRRLRQRRPLPVQRVGGSEIAHQSRMEGRLRRGHHLCAPGYRLRGLRCRSQIRGRVELFFRVQLRKHSTRSRGAQLQDHRL